MLKKSFIIASNWKMNPTSITEAKKLFTVYRNIATKNKNTTFVCAVPPVYLAVLGKIKHPKNLILAAENIFYEDSGSYTGAVSVPMIKDAGAGMTLIGHSERRNLFGVSDDIISKKIERAISHRLPVMVCFGEKDRDEQGDYVEELRRQIAAILQPFENGTKLPLLALAYEPVWAIGAGAKRAVTEDELFSTILLIRNILEKHVGKTKANKIPLLYGGSVNPQNATSLATVPGIGGFLIGRASLDKEKITAITKSV